MAQKKILITGVTGFIGSALAKTFMAQGHKVFCLARPRGGKSAYDRAIQAMRFWGEDVRGQARDNFVVCDGDIEKHHLGLDNKTIDLLRKEINEIVHCAALTEINQPWDKIANINITGTKHVLDLALELRKKRKLKKVNHLSTAYVCGNHEGVFEESDLDVKQSFSTTYERSKFEAELLIQTYRSKKLWVDIYRPPIVMGDLNLGRTMQFKNVYQLIGLCRLEIFNVLPILGSCINLVPIDVLAQAIVVLVNNTKRVNSNFHLFSQQVFPLKKILNIAGKSLDFAVPKLVSLYDFEWDSLTAAQAKIVKEGILPLNFTTTLSSDYTNKILQSFGFEFPILTDDYFKAAFRFFTKPKKIF